MGKRILIVEDDLDGQKMVAMILEHLKFEVDTVDDGEQASLLLFDSDSLYSGVMIDLAMPVKNGWELLQEILENPDTENLPCIAMTAFHSSRLQEKALQAGFVAYFPKPIDRTRLIHELGQLF